MNTKEIEILSCGEILRGFLDLPKEKPIDKKIPVVIQFHGMCGQCDSKIDLAFARYFTGIGMAVVRVNFLGHGNSTGDFLKVTVPGQLPQARAIYDYSIGLPFAGDIYLIAHSMGAVAATMLAAQIAQEERAKGMTCSRIRKMALLAPASVIEKLCRSGQFGDFEYDPAFPPERIDIPGTRFVFSREYLISGKEIHIMDCASQFPNPVCIIHGEKDDFLPLSEMKEFSAAFPKGELRILPDASHFFGGKKKEMVECVADFFAKID